MRLDTPRHRPGAGRLAVSGCVSTPGPPPLACKLTRFGFYALAATEPVCLETTHWANAETTCQMRRALRQRYSDRLRVLIRDNVSCHRALLVRRCAQELGIQLVYLLPYSPDLMLVESALVLHRGRERHSARDHLTVRPWLRECQTSPQMPDTAAGKRRRRSRLGMRGHGNMPLYQSIWPSSAKTALIAAQSTASTVRDKAMTIMQ